MQQNYAKMMKQVQKMQEQMAKAQEELANETVSASAGGGMVTVVVSGNLEVREVRIEKDAVDPDDVEMLQDLVVAAVTDALEQARKASEEKLARVTGGLRIPGM